MKSSTKRVIGNVSVGTFLAGVVAVLLVSHFDPNFLRNDPELTAEANAGTPIVQGPIVPKELPTAKASTAAEIADARQRALELGRSAATWDKNCVAWNLPEGGAQQQWANRVGASWLNKAGARCPDALTWPYYFIDGFESTSAGELKVTLEETAAADPHLLQGEPHTIHLLGDEILDATNGQFTDLTSIELSIRGEDTRWNVEVDDRA